MIQVPHLNFTDSNAKLAKLWPDVHPSIWSPAAGAGRHVDMILPGGKNTLGDPQAGCASGIAHAGALQANVRERTGAAKGDLRRSYQMLNETIIDEVESSSTQPGLRLNIPSPLHKTDGNQVTATWQQRCRRGFSSDGSREKLTCYVAYPENSYKAHPELRDGCQFADTEYIKAASGVADAQNNDNGLAFGTYLHSLFDSDAYHPTRFG